MKPRENHGRPPALSQRQHTALASCYWQPCKGCKRRAPVLRGVGCPAAGFDRYHASACVAIGRGLKQ